MRGPKTSTSISTSSLPIVRIEKRLHRVIVWVILADFDQLFAVVVAAVGMWSTLLQRCPHVHGDAGVGKQGSQKAPGAIPVDARRGASASFGGALRRPFGLAPVIIRHV